jgi:hypothetical protein
VAPGSSRRSIPEDDEEEEEETFDDVAAFVKEYESTQIRDEGSRFGRELLEGTDEGVRLSEELLNTINNAFEHECLAEAVHLLGARQVPDDPQDSIRGTKYILTLFQGVRFLAHQIWGIWFILRRWIFDVDLPGVLLADEMGLGKTFTVLATALYAKNMVIGLLGAIRNEEQLRLSVLFGFSVEQWAAQAASGFPDLSEAQRAWYPCTHSHPVPRRLREIVQGFQSRPTDVPPPWQPVLIVVLASVKNTFLSAVNTMVDGTQFRVIDLGAPGHEDLIHEDLNATPENLRAIWDIHIITYDSLTRRAQRNLQGTPRQLTRCQWSWGIFDEAHRFKGLGTKGWSVAHDALIGFKVQVTATPAYHILKDMASTTRWLFSNMPPEESLVDPIAVENHGPLATSAACKRLQASISSGKSPEEQQEASQAVIDAIHPWMIRRWSESRTASGAPLVPVPHAIHHPVSLEWTLPEQQEMGKVIARLKQQRLEGEFGVAWRIHRWQLACFSMSLEASGDREESGEWKVNWDDIQMEEGPIFRWLRSEFLPALIHNEAHDLLPGLNDDLVPIVVPTPSNLPQKAVFFCTLPGQVRHLSWWIHSHFNEQICVFIMVSEDTPARRTQIIDEFESSSACAVFITTTKLGGTGLNLVAANHAVVLQKPWVLNEQRQAFGRIVRLGQKRVPHTWLLNTGPSGIDDRITQLHITNGSGQLRVLHGLMNRPQISVDDIYNIIKTRMEETEAELLNVNDQEEEEDLL